MQTKTDERKTNPLTRGASVAVISFGLISGAAAGTQVIDVPVKDVITLTERVEERISIDRCLSRSSCDLCIWVSLRMHGTV